VASLALVVSLIVISLIVLGPISYILCSFSWMPKLIKYLLALMCLFVGVWALFIPVLFIQILGFVNLSIGLKIALAKQEKTTQA